MGLAFPMDFHLNLKMPLHSQLEMKKDLKLQRRRLRIPADESIGYNVFRQKAIPFAEPSDDSSKSFLQHRLLRLIG